jgi:hypothetical protein
VVADWSVLRRRNYNSSGGRWRRYDDTSGRWRHINWWYLRYRMERLAGLHRWQLGERERNQLHG